MSQFTLITKDKKAIVLGSTFLIAFVLLLCVSFIRAQANLGFTMDMLQNFSTVLLSIILETLPFVLLGSFISSLIQVFISEEAIASIIPKNKLLGLFAAAAMGIIFPVCECAIIPIVRRLIKKGVPLHIAITFMLAVPIVNPIVLMSTYYAFYNKPIFALIRGGFGFVCAILIGFTVGWLEEGKNPLKVDNRFLKHSSDSCGCGISHVNAKILPRNIVSMNLEQPITKFTLLKRKRTSKLSQVIEHTSMEFYDIGKYLTFGAIISASFQTFVSRGNIIAVGLDKNISVLVMIGFAFVISLCSEADAFVARSFLGQFTSGSIVAFLLFGPMLDIKNTLMLNSTFKKRFTVQLMLIIFIVCLCVGILINKLHIV